MIGRLEHLPPDKASKFISHPHAGSVITGFSADLAIPAHPQTIIEAPAKRRRTSPSTDSDTRIQQGKTTTPPPPSRTILNPTPPQTLNFIPYPSSFSKFSASPLLRPSIFVDSSSILANNHSIPTMPILAKTREFIHASLSRATWSSYSSAMNSFRKFEKETRSSHSWPLELGIIRAYTTFSLSSGRLSPSTVSSYLAGLRYLHIIRGFSVPSFLQDEHIKLIIKGAKNINSPSSLANRRRHVSIPILRILQEEINNSPLSGYLKTSLWALFSLAFFASARMGELVSNSRTSYDPNATLRIRDVLDRDSNILIHLRQPKSGLTGGKFLHLFPFPHLNLCPVVAVRKLLHVCKEKQLEAHLPLFRDDEGFPLNIQYINLALKELLKKRVDLSDHSISAHSFRAGIPSQLQRTPDLLDTNVVRGWSRWNSDSSDRYERLNTQQKKKLFEKISVALSFDFHSP